MPEPSKKKQAAGVAVQKKKTPTGLILQRDEIPSALFLFLYSLVEFIPAGGSGDVMGSQWVYLGLINIAAASYILLFRITNGNLAALFRANLAAVCYFIFVLLAGISIFFAINRVESAVNYARLMVTAIMVINLFLLLRDRLSLFRPLCILISVYALVQSLQALTSFFNGQNDTDISRLILGLTGNAGNKNIFSVSLVLKVPFIIGSIYYSGNLARMIFSSVLAVVASTIFIINARSSFLGLLLVLLTVIVFVFVINKSVRNRKQAFILAAYVMVPALMALFFSQYTIRRVIDAQDASTAYGTVFERLNTVSFTSEGSSSRINMWSSAADYIKKHPFTGSGYGNWKLAAVPYEKTYVDELRITKHVHNDFLEMAAELGVTGGLLYLLVFLLTALLPFRILISKSDEAIKIPAMILLAGLAAYSTDAFLNFPMERPVTQFFFALLFAFSLVLFFATKEKTTDPTLTKNKKGGKFFQLVLLLLSVPAVAINYSVYRSLVAQVKVNDDLQTANPVTRWQDIKDLFPRIPNLNIYGFPISHIKAFYLIIDKKYDTALALLNANAGVNPHLSLTEYLKAKIFRETGRGDSAFFYAQKAFYARPRARSHYELFNELCLEKKDSINADSAFKAYVSYRNEAWAWNRYISLIATLNPNSPRLAALVDSAISRFPNDPELLQKKAGLQTGNPAVATAGPADDEYYKNFTTGFDLFSKGKYMEAVPYFTKAAELKPAEYLPVENTGLCYYSTGNYGQALPYFNKVLRSFNPADGKAEFLKGICLLNLGNNNDGCVFLKKSAAKGFPKAAEQVRIYCR